MWITLFDYVNDDHYLFDYVNDDHYLLMVPTKFLKYKIQYIMRCISTIVIMIIRGRLQEFMIGE